MCLIVLGARHQKDVKHPLLQGVNSPRELERFVRESGTAEWREMVSRAAGPLYLCRGRHLHLFRKLYCLSSHEVSPLGLACSPLCFLADEELIYANFSKDASYFSKKNGNSGVESYQSLDRLPAVGWRFVRAYALKALLRLVHHHPM